MCACALIIDTSSLVTTRIPDVSIFFFLIPIHTLKKKKSFLNCSNTQEPVLNEFYLCMIENKKT